MRLVGVGSVEDGLAQYIWPIDRGAKPFVGAITPVVTVGICLGFTVVIFDTLTIAGDLPGR